MRTPPAGTWAQIRERLYKYRFVLLLIFLVAFMAVTSLFQLLHFPDWPLTLAFAFIVVAAINAASDKKILTWLATAIAIPTLVLSAFRTTLGGSTIEIATDLVAIALLVLMIVIVLRHIFSRTESNFNILSGAAVLYLLLAIAWAMVFRVTEELAPGAFRGFVSNDISPQNQYLFFSLTTLTTLGYGDITPVHPFARLFSGLEAVTGVLYLAILVSRLVSMYRR